MRFAFLLVPLLALGFALAPAEPASAHCAGGSHRTIGEVPPAPDDLDCDFIKDNVDNCPPLGYDDLRTRNPNQEDSDGDGVGDWCEVDDDGDGVTDWTDGKVEYESTRRKHDNCRTVFNPDQADSDRNGVGDLCEVDSDGDGTFDSEDNCRLVANRDQADRDGDRVGDVCDNDADGDYTLDEIDNCPGYPNPDQRDEDGDGVGALCDPDDAPRVAAPAPAPPAPAPGPVAAVADREAPRVTLRLKRTQRREEVEDGLIVRMSCSEACSATARVVVDRAVAKRLRLGRRTQVASGTAAVESAASTYAFVRFDARARKRLWAAKRTRLKLRLEVRDAAGNLRRASATLTLVR